MPRTRAVFACTQCGHSAPRRLGRCPACGEWNTFDADVSPPPAEAGGWLVLKERSRPIGEIEERPEERFSSGFAELDRVLGGGFVRGSATLLGGEPGIGKSTLVLQAADRAARTGRSVLYLTAEESAAQVALRARRLGAAAPTLFVASGTSLLDFAADIATRNPDLVLVDSIQTVASPDVPAVPGTISQVRECAARLTAAAKATGQALVLIGHVTKEGAVAGPRTLEHLVDAVLYLEGDALQNYRLLRGVKNRFGSTGEIGILEMSATGLADVGDPSRYFHSRSPIHHPGCVVTPSRVGTRTLLVDVQALTCRAAFGAPARRVSGIDASRLAMILAVLEKHAGLALSGDDVFVSAAGGARLEEPSADLAIALAIASAHRSRRFPPDLCAFGEIGLGGEIRPCGPLQTKLDEAARLGFRGALVPEPAPAGGAPLAVRPVKDVGEALEALA